MENKCKVKNCIKPYSSKGYCHKHYENFHKYGHPLGKFKGNKKARIDAFKKRKIWELNRVSFTCKIKGCKKNHSSKGYCKKHYAMFRYRKIKGYSLDFTKSVFHQCEIPDCKNRTYRNKKYCCKHLYRIKHHLPLDLNIRTSIKGERNPNWNGGTSEYPNHYQMKLLRIKKLKQTKGLCEICSEKGKEVHHKDGSKTNHTIKNFIFLCHKCHMKIFHSKPHISKYTKLYGMTLIEMARKYGGTASKYLCWQKQGKLKKYLNSLTKSETSL
jgi:hypothetical protein